MEKRARLKYCENYKMGNAEREGVVIEIDTDGSGWGFSSFFPLVAKDGASEIGKQDERDYIHWTILRKINELLQLGYNITSIDI